MKLKELEELRAKKVAEMEAIVEKRSDNMNEEALTAVKSIKDEIKDIDNKIEAINELRSVAKETATPEVSKEKTDKELRAAFNEYLRGVITKKQLEQRANTIGVNGPDVVPEDFYRQLQEAIDEYGMITGKATHLQTSDNGDVLIPMINDTANQGQWTSELGAIAQTDFTTSQVKMSAFKISTGIQVSTELLEDAFFDVSGYIAKALGERIARTTENAFIMGDGASKPEGILKNSRTVEVPTDSAGQVTSADLLGMIHAIPPTQRNGAEFLVSDDVLKSLLLETDNDGRPMLQPSADATTADGIRYTIGGYPLSANYELEQIGTGNEVGLFGNFKNYWIRDVRGVTLKRDDYSDMNIDAVNFYVTMRLDGKVISANTVFAKLVVA